MNYSELIKFLKIWGKGMFNKWTLYHNNEEYNYKIKKNVIFLHLEKLL